jgi:hypothetical protein
MQRKEVSEWIVISLSAKQALLDGDFEHLDVLLQRRDEVLNEWEKNLIRFNEKEMGQIRDVSSQLESVLKSHRDQLGVEIGATKNRSAALKAYRSAS